MITYYELRGTGYEKRKYPSGMFRVVETGNTRIYERMDENGAWVKDYGVSLHLAGYSVDAYEITEEQAEKVLAYYRGREKPPRYGTVYFELRGIGEEKDKYPSGMFRIIYHEKGGMHYERMDGNGNWVKDSSVSRFTAGYADDAEEITEEWAEEVLEYFRKKKKKK